MNDFFGNIVANAKNVSVPVILRRNPGGLELPDVLAADLIESSYWRSNTTPVSITPFDLSSLNDSHSPGGWIAVNDKGLYRFDVPDAAFISGANWCVLTVQSTSSFAFNERYNLELKDFLQIQGTGFDQTLTNSYMTVSGANDYFDTKFNVSAVWDSVEATDKQKALIEATRLIDGLNFKYDKTDPLQTLQFPRNLQTEIPEAIKIATCEIAFEIINGYDPNLQLNNLQVMSHGYGSTKTQYTRDFVLEHLSHGIPSALAWRYLRPYLRDPNRLIVTRS